MISYEDSIYSTTKTEFVSLQNKLQTNLVYQHLYETEVKVARKENTFLT